MTRETLQNPSGAFWWAGSAASYQLVLKTHRPSLHWLKTAWSLPMKLAGLLHWTHTQVDSQLASFGKGGCQNKRLLLPGTTQTGKKLAWSCWCVSLSSAYLPLYLFATIQRWRPYSLQVDQYLQPFTGDLGSPHPAVCCVTKCPVFLHVY